VSVLFIDDDRELVDMLVFAFRRAGLVTTTAHDVESGLARFEADHPDLIVLDLHLGGSSGFDFLTQVRRVSQVPIIILTALASEDDKVKGLSLGADDYITKPFSHRELLTRILMRLRRSGQAAPRPMPEVLRVSDIELDANAHTVQRGGKQVNLTVTEFRLLHHLLVNAGQVVTTEDILRHVWGNPDPTDSDVLRVTLHRLRRKLGENGTGPGILRTVPGVGVLLHGERVVIAEAAAPQIEELPSPIVRAPSPVAVAQPVHAPPMLREPAVMPPQAESGGRIERDGAERLRLRFRPDAEVESILFVTPSARLESYDPETEAVTWTMPVRGERTWDVFEAARRRGFVFAEDIDVPMPSSPTMSGPVAVAPAAPAAPPPQPAPAPARVAEQPRLVPVVAAPRVATKAQATSVAKPTPMKEVAHKTGLSIRQRLTEAGGTRMSASGRTAMMLLAITMLAAVLSIWSEIGRLGLLTELERVGEISAAAFQQSEARQLLLAITLLAFYVLSAGAFLVWLNRSYTRLRARKIAGLHFTPITAIIWFFVPIAFLFMPRRVVNELWHAAGLPDEGHAPRRTRVPMLVSVWWTAFVAFAISAVLTGATTRDPSLEDLFRQTWTNFASDLLALLAGALAIVVIGTIELRQPAASAPPVKTKAPRSQH
jgi:two-component system OmpR family response regulator